jgi:hypothetical protein
VVDPVLQTAPAAELKIHCKVMCVVMDALR